MKNKILFLLWCIFLVAPAAASAQDHENHALENHALENHALENHALENHALENHALENHALENHALENHALENHALENHALENHALENHALENRALYQTQNFEIKLSPEQNDQFYNMNVATFCSSQDFDNDRISDCDDRCPMSTPGQTVDMEGCGMHLMADIRGVHFDFDKATLRPENVMILNEMAETLHQNPYLQIKVAGHTDSIGSRAYNKELSMRRAEAVYGYLVARGIDPSRLWGPTGYGESRPIAPNKNADGSDNPEGRAKNHRAELNVEND